MSFPKSPDGRTLSLTQRTTRNSWIFFSPFVSFPPDKFVSCDPNLRPSLLRPPSLQDVQVDRRVLDQGHEPVVDFLDDETLLRFSLPAPLHELVDLFGTRPRPLQLPALRDALDRLHKESNLQSNARVSAQSLMSCTYPIDPIRKNPKRLPVHSARSLHRVRLANIIGLNILPSTLTFNISSMGNVCTQTPVYVHYRSKYWHPPGCVFGH